MIKERGANTCFHRWWGLVWWWWCGKLYLWCYWWFSYEYHEDGGLIPAYNEEAVCVEVFSCTESTNGQNYHNYNGNAGQKIDDCDENNDNFDANIGRKPEESPTRVAGDSSKVESSGSFCLQDRSFCCNFSPKILNICI